VRWGRQVRRPVPDRVREEDFARLDAEGAIPPRKKVSPAAWRRAAVPLAAAAALGFFLLASRDAVRAPDSPGPAPARVETSSLHAPSPQGNGAALSTEDREMLALLDLLEDPVELDASGDAEGMELLAPGDSEDPPNRTRGGRSGA
jgi:hypothetical protein